MKRVLLMAIIALALTGCSRTVTQIVTYGDQMVVDVTLRGTMEITANRYFLVLAANNNYKIPLPPPDGFNKEFLEPGTAPQPGSGTIADYYNDFYSTWSGYVIAEPGGYFLEAGPFILNQPATREFLSSLGEINEHLSFNFRLSQVFGSNVPDQIYFDFVTVNYPANAAKMPADHLTTTNAYIKKITGSTLTIADPADPSIAPSLDILSCTVTIQ